ncbi:MAG TPA: LysM peptidoglycan-binding domain-containing protein [Chloroflexota bacterium]|nr:LysM peptidoglycan-binding domain-containing protein [Chloroflexota bacterium]
MQEYVSASERRYPSPSAQRRDGEHWKARFGLGSVILLTLISAAIMFRIAGLGVGTATSAFRGQGAAPQRPAAAATAPSAAGQQAGQQQAGQQQAGQQQAATAVAQAQPTAAPAAVQPTVAPTVAPTAVPQPTARPNQREPTIQSGDSLWAISQRYGTTMDAIVAANNLPGRNAFLRVGQVLVIPG